MVLRGKSQKQYIETKNFEKVWSKAGVLVFTSLGSSTLGYALNLPIPIVYINSDGTPLNKRMLSTLKKRLVIINNKYENAENSISCNDLETSIKKARKLINLQVVSKLTG